MTPAPTHDDPAMAERSVAELRTVDPMEPPPDTARFGPGERVRVKRMHPAGHTRCPALRPRRRGRRRGRPRRRPACPTGPPTASGVDPEPVYSVVFRSHDLWGPSDEGDWTVALDLWDSYLEAE